jgi:NAD+ kinase
MKALVVSKITSLVHYRRKMRLDGDALIQNLASLGIPAKEIAESDARHRTTLATTVASLKEHKIAYQLITTEVKHVSLKGIDLVIAVGGDGTILSTAHLIKTHTPLLGVNSDPHKSRGYLSCCSQKDVAKKIQAFIAGKARILEVTRLKVQLSDKTILPLALNDVFVCGIQPFDTVKYEMQAGKTRTLHADSGLLICTGAGSTAWNFNASRMYVHDVRKLLRMGGFPEKRATMLTKRYNQDLIFPWDARTMRYYSRDLIEGARVSVRLHAGFTTRLSLSSRMYEGKIVVDNKFSYDFSHGKKADIQVMPKSLLVIR